MHQKNQKAYGNDHLGIGLGLADEQVTIDASSAFGDDGYNQLT